MNGPSVMLQTSHSKSFEYGNVNKNQGWTFDVYFCFNWNTSVKSGGWLLASGLLHTCYKKVRSKQSRLQEMLNYCCTALVFNLE